MRKLNLSIKQGGLSVTSIGLLVLFGLCGFETLGQAPDWAIEDNALQHKMSIVAKIADECVLSADPDDIIGVFDIHGELRGVNFTNGTDNKAFISVGSNTTPGDALFFKVYDAQDDKVYNIYNTPAIFVASTKIGSSDDPLILNFDSNTTAMAGGNQEIFNMTVATLDAQGSGTWSIIEGVGGGFSNPTDPGATFTGVLDESYLLVWTLNLQVRDCLAESGEVRITFVLEEVENSLRTCTDGLDNDGDGLTDCDDEECQRPVVTGLSITDPTSTSCEMSNSDGILTILHTFGDSFSIDSGMQFGDSPTFLNLKDGYYPVAILNDLTTCRTDTLVKIINPLEIVTQTVDVVLDCVTDENTTLAVDASMGTAPYNFSWKNQIDEDLLHGSNVDEGKYYVIVTDINGCVQSDSLMVTRTADPLAGVSGPFLSGPTLLCMGLQDVLYELNVGTDMTDIVWSYGSPNVTIAELSGGTMGSVDYGADAISDYLKVSLVNYCSVKKDSLYIDYAVPYLCNTFSNCPETVNITTGLLQSDNAPQVYRASQTMHINALFSNGIYEFSAGISHDITSGFEVPQGVALLIDIQNCTNN